MIYTRSYSQNLFNYLPSHLVIEICEYLDNESQLNAIIAFNQWTFAFESSSMLMNDFTLNLDNEFFKEYRILSLPNLPIKNVTISIDKENFKPSCYRRTLKKYSESLVNVEFYEMSIDTPNLAKMLNAVPNVTHLEFDRVKIDDEIEHPFSLPKLKSLKINARCVMMKQWMTNFKNNQSIKKLHFSGSCGSCFWESSDINPLASTLPNLRRLIINHEENQWEMKQLVDANFSAKLKSLEIDSLHNHHSEISIGFLRTQMETLKDLKISNYSFHEMMDMEMENTMQFILNEMKLRNFQCNEDKVIVNYERQTGFEPMRVDFDDNYDSDFDDDSE